MSQTPTICRMVQYRLNVQDAELIEHRRKAAGTIGNHAREGAIYPAVVVAVFDVEPAPLVNLRVILDGDDLYWATSRAEGDEPGSWS